jgi:hypothetical protein
VAQAAVGVAAISLAVVLVTRGGSHTANTTSAPAAGAAASPTVGAQPITREIQSYTAKSFRRLANDLVGEVRHGVKFGSTTAASPLSPVPSPADSASLTERATSCIEQGTGVVAGTRLYFFQQAQYEGADVYIGAFLSGTGTSRSMIVVAVTVDGCETRQFIRQAV